MKIYTNNENSVGYRLTLFLEKLYPGESHASKSRNIGFPNTSVLEWEGGRAMPEDAYRRLNELGCDLNWLLTGKGEMYADGGSIPRGDAVPGKEDLNLHGLPSISADGAKSTNYLKPNESMTVKELLAVKTEAMQIVTMVDNIIEKKVSKL